MVARGILAAVLVAQLASFAQAEPNSSTNSFVGSSPGVAVSDSPIAHESPATDLAAVAVLPDRRAVLWHEGSYRLVGVGQEVAGRVVVVVAPGKVVLAGTGGSDMLVLAVRPPAGVLAAEPAHLGPVDPYRAADAGLLMAPQDPYAAAPNSSGPSRQAQAGALVDPYERALSSPSSSAPGPGMPPRDTLASVPRVVSAAGRRPLADSPSAASSPDVAGNTRPSAVTGAANGPHESGAGVLAESSAAAEPTAAVAAAAASSPVAPAGSRGPLSPAAPSAASAASARPAPTGLPADPAIRSVSAASAVTQATASAGPRQVSAAVPEVSATAAPEVAPVTRIEATIGRRELSAALADFDRLSKEVQVEMVGRGALIQGLARGTLLDRMGLRAGDLVHQVAGEELKSLDSAARIYSRVLVAERFDVLLERGGRELVVHCQVR